MGGEIETGDRAAGKEVNLRLMRIALFGGTFNPVHVGHLVAAQDAHERFGFDRTVWVPVARPSHKSFPDLAPAEDRLQMLRLATDGDDRFEVSDWEIRRGGPSYSIETVRHWRRKRPDAELFFLIGSDSLRYLSSWKEIDALLQLCRFVTAARPGFDPAAICPDRTGFSPEVCKDLRSRVVSVHPVAVSSSEIRDRLARGSSIRYLVPEAVRSWILSRGLYVRKGETPSIPGNC